MNVRDALLARGIPEDKARRAAGLPSVADATVTGGLDARILAACADLGCTARSFSLRKKTTITALPDFRVYAPSPYWVYRRVAVWMEAKSRGDKLTERQADFLTAEYEAGEIVVCGEVVELRAIVNTIKRGDLVRARTIGWETVQAVLARGYRKAR